MVIFASLLRAAWLALLWSLPHAAKVSSTSRIPNNIDVLIFILLFLVCVAGRRLCSAAPNDYFER
jgi:hypothetical protein